MRLVILFDIERIEPIAIMPDGVIQKMRVAALSAAGAKYLAPAKPKVLGLAIRRRMLECSGCPRWISH